MGVYEFYKVKKRNCAQNFVYDFASNIIILKFTPQNNDQINTFKHYFSAKLFKFLLFIILSFCTFFVEKCYMERKVQPP